MRSRRLLPASWRGIPFLVRTEALTEGGRRIVLHEFPNSDERYVEDLGRLPPKFSVTAFVTGPDFLDRAAQLERALQEPGSGRLSIPAFGVFTLFALPYTKNALQTEVGEIKFNLSFVTGKTVSGPSQAPDTVQTVYANGDAARESLAVSLGVLWDVPTETANVLTAQFDLTQAVNGLSVLNTELDNLSELNSTWDLVTLNSQSLVRDAEELADTFIRQNWQQVSEGLSDGAGLSPLLDITRFGSGLSLSLADIRSATASGADTSGTEIPLWPETTAGRVKRNRNRLTLINCHRVAALVSAYEQAADRAYNTDDEIEETRLSLENAYQRLMRVDTEDSELPQSQPGVRFAVDDVRLSALSVLDEKEQTAHTLTTVTIATQISAFVLAYDLYAENLDTSEQVTERGVGVRVLNLSEPADRMTGRLTVVQL